jgi:hypothetical protein
MPKLLATILLKLLTLASCLPMPAWRCTRRQPDCPPGSYKALASQTIVRHTNASFRPAPTWVKSVNWMLTAKRLTLPSCQ